MPRIGAASRHFSLLKSAQPFAEAKFRRQILPRRTQRLELRAARSGGVNEAETIFFR
jgi:hypothetical protein